MTQATIQDRKQEDGERLRCPQPEGVVLRGVSWTSYEFLLKDLEDQSVPRIAYSGGVLEIMSPSLIHEMWNRDLASLVRIVARQWRINIKEAGSTTLKRPDVEGGIEPDSSFYVQNANRMFRADRIDLQAGDPVPDLVIEIEVTSSSLPKLPLFARLGIPEVWRVDGSGFIQFFVLGDEGYSPSKISRALPLLNDDDVNLLLAESANLMSMDWEDRVQQWAAGRNATAS